MSDTKKYHQYFSTRPMVTITMPNGNRIRFVGGVYMTANQSEIDFLQEQIRIGHPIIYIKEGATVVDADALDPLAAVKKKAIEEYLQQQKLASDPNRNMGNTAPASASDTGMVTSSGIKNITVGPKLSK